GKTPAQVAEVVGPLIRAASQDEAGIVQLADAATAQGLTDTERVLTPATLGAAMNAHVLGMGQTWQDVTEQRTANVWYTNTTGRPIFVAAGDISGKGISSLSLYVDDQMISRNEGGSNELAGSITVSGLVPPGSTYRVTRFSAAKAISWWKELR